MCPSECDICAIPYYTILLFVCVSLSLSLSLSVCVCVCVCVFFFFNVYGTYYVT